VDQLLPLQLVQSTCVPAFKPPEFASGISTSLFDVDRPVKSETPKDIKAAARAAAASVAPLELPRKVGVDDE
jgi:hypothetical protein